MTGTDEIQLGSEVLLDGQQVYAVCGFEAGARVKIRAVGGEEQVVGLARLQVQRTPMRQQRMDLASLTEEQFKEAQRRYEIIKPLVDKQRCGGEMIKEAARAANVSAATIYRWLTEFRKGRVMSSMLRRPRSDTGKSRIGEVAEAIVAQVIAEYWLSKQKHSYAKVHRELQIRCRNANVRPPSLPTLIDRIIRIEPKETALRRHGRAEADQLKLIEGTVNASRPYAVVQIDHTRVDIELVDSVHRVAIGRPWITVAIDVFSRMILGWYISFDPPGMLGTGICIANAILPKSRMMQALGASYEYPCVGIPRIVHMDNAREFHSKTLDRACQEYGIDIQYRKVATPRYGGHIERLLGTFATEVKALSGATFSNFIEKGGYDSEKRAVFTLAHFERWVAHLFLGVYHQRVHSALLEPPVRRYMKGALGTQGMPFAGLIDEVPDEHRLRLDFLPMFEGTIQTYGVRIDHICYTSDALRRWVGAKDPSAPTKARKFLFRRDPRDISYIYFYDPDARFHIRIPYRDRSRPPMSLWELRAVQKFLKDEGRASVNEAEIFRAFDAMRKIEDQEKQVTHKVRRSNAVKRGLRRKESPQAVVLKDQDMGGMGVVDETRDEAHSPAPPDLKASQGLDGFDEIERY